jgi:polysaccharide biosynthesis transport protein
MILPVVLIVPIVVFVALTMPPTYRSTATILIEQQQIPQDLVRTTVTSFADQRVQVISQRIMTTVNLSRIIEQYGLYSEVREQQPMSVVVGDMRDSMQLRMVSADVVDPRSGRAQQASIAFTLSFDHGSPQVAKQVTDELVSLFMEENLRTRREAAREASVFLGAEADRLAAQIADLEARVARFKEEQGDSLPEMQQVNAQFLRRTEEQIARNEMEMRLLEDRIVMLEGELSRTDRYGDEVGSRRVLTPGERLMELELQHLALSAQKTERHPDVVQLEREIQALRLQTGGLDRNEIESMLATARATLDERRRDLTDSHPSVRDAERAVAALEEQLANAGRSGGANGSSSLSENPSYYRLIGQLRAARSELEHLREKKVTLTEQLSDYEDRVRAAPMVEREYRTITRDYDNALAKFREVRAKQMEAELGQSLEEESKAERFVLIEPASMPVEPIRPNRKRIMLMGFALAMGAGVGMVALREVTADAIYGSRAVAAITGAPPLGVVPYIATAEEIRRKWILRILVVLVAFALLAGAAAAVHHYVRPLDVAVYQLLQRAGLIDTGTPAPGGN